MDSLPEMTQRQRKEGLRTQIPARQFSSTNCQYEWSTHAQPVAHRRVRKSLAAQVSPLSLSIYSTMNRTAMARHLRAINV